MATEEQLVSLVNELIIQIDNLTGYNTPSAYDDEHDDAGHCPYCRGWNMEHEKTCSIVKAESVVKKAKNTLSEGER